MGENWKGYTLGKDLSMQQKMDAKNLSEKLGYEFKDKTLLHQALSHRSMGTVSNERLEFLGDSALNLIIATELYYRYPQLEEGALSRLRANLVNGKVLAELAGELNIGAFLYLGEGEQKSGGAQRASILADACEAIIGAIYLDSDLKTCNKCVLNWYKTRLESISLNYKDPKTELQEWLQARKLPLPHYEIVKVEGAAHAQTFHIRCHVDGVNITTLGIATNRRQAEQIAAEKFLIAQKN